MKNAFRVSGTILLMLSVFLIQFCKKDKPTPPVLTTTAVTAISYTTATSGGNVTNEGGAPIVSRGVCWNTSSNPTIANSMTLESGGLGAFTSNITQLTPNILYYVRAYALSIAGTGYGDQVSFTTTQVAVPVLTTTTITSVSQTAAVSGGNITADNGGSVTAKGVCWSIVTNPTTANNKTIDGTGIGAYTSLMTGLTVGTTFYVRAYATNSTGIAYGNQVSFTTSQIATASLTTTVIASILQTTAVSGGNITADNGGSVTARGVCWGTTTNPTTANNKTNDGTGIGSFVSNLSGLQPSTLYYVRSYATNSAGTAYGNEISFTTQNITVSDFDGNVYHTVTIGTQVWMVENLKTTKYNDGTSIPLVSDGTAWISLSTPGYCWYNNDAATNKATYGAIYNWYTVNTGKLCPAGWHIPTDAEWTTLTTYLGESIAGAKLKETGTTHWGYNYCATNETGFTALPGGWRYNDGTFQDIGYNGNWWSSTEQIAAGTSWFRRLESDWCDVRGGSYVKILGYSVRCLRDN